MAVTTLTFAAFVLVTLLVYHRLSHPFQNRWLLFASYVFYMTWDWRLTVVLLALTVGNYLLAKRIEAATTQRKGLLWFAIVFNIAALVFFKYADFFVPSALSLLALLGIGAGELTIRVALPLGLSFMTLEAISYLIDVYRGQLLAASNLRDFALYVAYFPKRIAGPIERARTFLPKLAQPRTLDSAMLSKSVMLILVGLVRKLIFADLLAAIIPPDLYSSPELFTSTELLLWVFASIVYVYNDFAGYSNIVQGVSLLFGIELSQNFAFPLFSRSITEFWTRWHITLSNWLRDYVFFPTSRSLLRRYPTRPLLYTLIPPILTMLVSALWHGISAQLLVWGVLSGLCLSIEGLLFSRREVVPMPQRSRLRQGLGVLSVLIIVMALSVPFSTELSTIPAFWQGVFSLSATWFNKRALMIVPALLLDWVQYHYGEFVFLRLPRPIQLMLVAVVIFILLLVALMDMETLPFVYQEF